MSELRREPRYAIALTCEIHAGETVVRGESKDLSRGGISIFLTEPLPVSTPIDLALALVFGDNSFSEPLKLKAMIVWCTKLAGRYQIGAKFNTVSNETRNFLELFLEFLEGGDDDEPPKMKGR